MIDNQPHNKMKPLYNLSNSHKENILNGMVYDILKQIDKRTDKWFDEVFSENSPYKCEEISTRNLLDDIDYMLTEAIWLIEMIENLGFECTPKRFVESIYNTYTEKEDGYRFIIRNRYYNPFEHRVWSDDELKERDEELSRISKEVINEILNEIDND
jgi:hypothetical protein